MKILVAEDEPILLNAISFKLNKEGYEVIKAENGKEAIEAYDKHDPDLVITDMMMPFANGLEVINWVKQLKGKNIPVIILSAMGQENAVLEAFKVGADDYITKPFSPNELIVRVKKLLK